MKSTGIIRRIDDLGRVVVPKEIRRTLGIWEGDPMELFVEGNKVIFCKYSPMRELKNLVENLDSFIQEECDESHGKALLLEKIDEIYGILKERQKS